MEVSQNTYKVTMTVSSENGNQFTFIAQILKVIPKEKLDAVRSTFADGDDSSDSDGLYENPTTDKDEEIKEKGEEIDQKQIYCVELRKKKGSKADFLEFFRSFRVECHKLNNADVTASNLMDS